MLPHTQKGLSRFGEVKALETGRLFWIISVGPIREKQEQSQRKRQGNKKQSHQLWPGSSVG